MAKKYLDNLVIENAKILFKNFSGAEAKFNPKGKRNFCVLIDTETAIKLQKDGWSIKYFEPREEGDEPQAYLKTHINYDGKYQPEIYMVTKRKKQLLNADTVGCLDRANITYIDLIISPYFWEIENGASGVKAFVNTMYCTVEENMFADKYADDAPFEADVF